MSTYSKALTIFGTRENILLTSGGTNALFTLDPVNDKDSYALVNTNHVIGPNAGPGTVNDLQLAIQTWDSLNNSWRTVVQFNCTSSTNAGPVQFFNQAALDALRRSGRVSNENYFTPEAFSTGIFVPPFKLFGGERVVSLNSSIVAGTAYIVVAAHKFAAAG